MSKSKFLILLQFTLVALFMVTVGNSATLPTSKFNPKIEQLFLNSFDDTWKSIITVIEQQHGSIFLQEKEAGMLGYSMDWGESNRVRRVYVNVLVKQSEVESGTLVYVFPRNQGSMAIDGINEEFFRQLKQVL